MVPNREYILSLARGNGWTQTELAQRMGVSRAHVWRFAVGKRKGGRKLFSGILKAFPFEPIDKLFFLP